MLYPEKDLNELQQKLTAISDQQYMVVCFCAAWCKTCSAFEPQIKDLANQYPQHVFVWVDVEEHENLLIDEDIEDFPTILIQNKKGTVFYGPLLPHAQHLARLLEQIKTKTQYIQPTADFTQLVIAATK